MECKILPEKCIACGLCQVYAPNIFDYTEEGIVLFKDDPELSVLEINQADLNEAITAYRKCPVRAIELVDET